MSKLIEIQRSKKYGDFSVFLTYREIDPHEDPEPAIEIRANRFGRDNAYVIMLSAAWKYVNPHEGTHSKYMLVAAPSCAKYIGLGDDTFTSFRIAEAIIENIPELLAMKPVRREQKVVGEATIQLDGHSMTTEITR